MALKATSKYHGTEGQVSIDPVMFFKLILNNHVILDSILLETDQKFGPSVPNADPNFQAATNGNNSNPV